MHGGGGLFPEKKKKFAAGLKPGGIVLNRVDDELAVLGA